MSNDFFRFRKFTVWQDRCAMKVGTDGVLLGAWARGGLQTLDIGTGTGLVALIMAQRCPEAAVTAIEIDHDAAVQAAENVARSPYSDRVRVVESPLQKFTEGKYDAIVSNPPFYDDSLKNPDPQRAMARHTTTLTYRDLFRGVSLLLAPDGEFSAIIPANCRPDFDAEAAIAGLQPCRVCEVRTVSRKKVSRLLLSYTLHHADKVEMTSLSIHADGGGYSDEYKDLVRGIVEYVE